MSHKFIQYRGAVYQSVASRSVGLPTWTDIWDRVQDTRAFRTELDTELRHSDKDEAEIIDGMEEEYYDYYDDIVAKLSRIDGADCWRAVTLSEQTDPVKLMRLGVYWSFDPKEAVPHWSYLEGASKDVVAVFRGRINLSVLDTLETVLANVAPGTRESGTELRFIPGRKLWIYDVSLYPIDSLSEELSIQATRPDRVEPIKAWRTI